MIVKVDNDTEEAGLFSKPTQVVDCSSGNF